MLAGALCVVLVWMLMPTVVSAPSSRKRSPSAIEALTEPPLESSTMVAPPSCRPRANSSNSLGLSAVTIPAALTQPRQFGWQSTQVNFIGNLRASRATPACTEPLSIATNAMQRPAPTSSIQPRISAQRARSDVASDRARWAEIRGWMLLVGAGLCIALVAMLSGSVHAGVALEARKLPMKFTWVDCQPNCRGWVNAAGIVTADSPREFDEFARGRQLGGATIVLDSSGGSVNASIALGLRFRELGALTTVGISIQTNTTQSAPANIAPVAYCESMCVFLLLSGTTRYVPDTAHVRVHQIWLGDRANDAKAATYSADDLMIVERDIGRLAKYTFDMGGTGDLLLLSLNVPPWEDLHGPSREELGPTNLHPTR